MRFGGHGPSYTNGFTFASGSIGMCRALYAVSAHRITRCALARIANLLADLLRLGVAAPDLLDDLGPCTARTRHPLPASWSILASVAM